MTFLQVVNIIRDTALAQPNVNTVVREFLDLNREDTKYSAVVIQDRDGLRDRIVEQDWNTYTFHLGYVDRLTFDEKNRDDIFSTGINVINNIVASIRERWDLEVSVIDRFSTFNQRFTASCAGVYVVLAIQVPVSDCVDGEETDIYDKFSVDITNNGHYHYVPDGRPVNEIDIVVNVENQKPEDHLVETITSNGSYHYEPEVGRVFNEADITVDVQEKPEESLVETISSNGSYHYEPEEGSVFGDADITVDVHPSNSLSETYTTNGTKTITGEFNGGIIDIDVHPTRDLRDTVTINGEHQWPGEWRSVRVAVDVHPSDRLERTITSNGIKGFSGEWKDALITVAVPSDQKPEEGLERTITSNGSYHYEPEEGSVFSGADITVNVHPSQSLVETITSNGSYSYPGEYAGAAITVSVSAEKPEESLVETISSNGSYHYDPTAGSVFSGADITVDVHPSNVLSKSYYTNGTKTITGEFNGGTVNINVHPSTRLSETITSNGSYSYSGEYAGADITVAVERYANTLRISQTAYNNLSVKDPDTIYLIYY